MQHGYCREDLYPSRPHMLKESSVSYSVRNLIFKLVKVLFHNEYPKGDMTIEKDEQKRTPSVFFFVILLFVYIYSLECTFCAHKLAVRIGGKEV